MTLAQLAECLNISTKLASRLVHEKGICQKVGREYRISKNSVVEFVRGKKKTHEKKLCCKCNFEPTGLDN